MPVDPAAIKALTFDVFGTVVDWRGSIIREGQALGAAKKLAVDWEAFADAWRAGYGPAMDRVRHGDLPWMNIDALHRLILDQILQEFGIRRLKESEKDHLNRVWHRLSPWPDAVRGLKCLKRKFVITTLSNGNIALLTNMAKHAGLPSDCILSAELFHDYKPEPGGPSGCRRPARRETTRGADGRRPTWTTWWRRAKRGCAPPSSDVRENMVRARQTWPRRSRLSTLPRETSWISPSSWAPEGLFAVLCTA